MRISVSIPAYDERENVQRLLPSLRSLCPEADLIVIDDNSPDGTGDLVETLRQTDPHVHLIRRPGKNGYASALKAGHQYGLDHGAEILCQMDADWSHDPRVLPVLLGKAEEYDVVLGSRYISGGGTKNWGIFRRILSRGGNAFARAALKLPSKDCTGGYRCYRRAAVERSGILGVRAEGYCFQIVTLFQCYRAGLSIHEVPILFEDRRFGKSKLSKAIIFEALLVVLKLWLRGR